MVKLKVATKPLEPLKQVAKDIVQINLAEEMQQSYLEYCLASNARSIPHFADGLIPVQRRMLWTAFTEGFNSHKPFVKVAKICGALMGNFHPHATAEGSFFTIANEWNNLVTLMNLHGNGGDATSPPASGRYVEGRLSKYSEAILLQETDTLLTKPNYDGSLQEPIMLNALIPNLLVFGSQAFSVGYATHCLQHNINEVISATIKFIESGGKKRISLAPDFKQGCDILASKETLQQYADTGHATFKLRAKLVSVETEKQKRTTFTRYTFENIPYGTNVEKIGDQLKKAAESLKHGDLQLVSIEDECDRTGDRMAVVSKRTDDISELLYLASDLQNSVSANNTVLNEFNIPTQMGAAQLISLWYDNRKTQVVRWASYSIQKLLAKLHIVEGYIKLLQSKTEAIKIIQDAADAIDARKNLMKRFDLSETQANAILELKLKQITKLNLKEFEVEAESLKSEIEVLKSYENDPSQLILSQLKEAKTNFGIKRSCNVVDVIASPTAEIQTKLAPMASPPSKKITFFSLNMAKGIVESGANKSCFVAETTDKIVAIAEDGLLYKFSAAHRGPITDKPLKILWCEKESKCRESGLYIELLAKESGSKGRLVGKALKISDLVSATSKGSYIGFRPDKNLDFRVAKSGVERDELQTKISLKHHKFSFIV